MTLLPPLPLIDDRPRAVFLILSTPSLSAKGVDGYIIETRGPQAAAERAEAHHTSDNALAGMVPGHGLWVLTCLIDEDESGNEPLLTEIQWRVADADEITRMVKGETILAPSVPPGVPVSVDAAHVDFAVEHSLGTAARP